MRSIHQGASIKKRVVAGMAASLGGFGVKTLLNLAIIPLVIAKLGALHYGVYVVLVSVIEMVGDLASGITNSFNLRLAQTLPIGASHPAPASHLAMMRVSLWTHLAASITVATVGLILMPLFNHLIAWPPSLPLYALVSLALLEGCLLLFGGFFRSILSAHTRLGVAHTIDMGQAIASNLLIVGLLWLKAPLLALLLARCVTALAALSMLAWVSRTERRLQQDWHPRRIQKVEALSCWDVCWVNTLIMMISILSCRFDSLIIGSTLSLVAVAAYGVVQRIYGQAVFLGQRLASVIMPVMTRYTLDADRVSAFFLRTSQGLAFFSAFLMIWLTWFFPDLFYLLGQRQLNIQPVLPVLWVLIPHVVVYLTGIPANSYLYNHNLYGRLLRWSAMASAVNLLISVALVKPLGLIAPALGTLVSTLLDRALFNIPTACRLQGIPMHTYLRYVLVNNLLAWLTAFVLLGASTPWLMDAHPLVRFLVAGIVALAGSSLVWAWQNLLPAEQAYLMQWSKNATPLGLKRP